MQMMKMISNILQTNTFEPILIKKALGSWFWDTNGKKYLDCESGMWCVNLGHNHPKVIDAMKNQMDEIIHRNKMFLTPITIEAAERVLKYFPNKYDRITFLNSGSEAVEFAINFAKKVTGRDRVLSLQNSYLGAFGTAKKASYTSSSNSKLKIPFQICDSNNCDCIEKFGPLLDDIFLEKTNAPACFVLEPIIVSGGIYKPCSKYIEYICKKIHECGGLIIIDEVTTGFGRAGYKFGYEYFKIIPDINVLGKALGNGYPISAIITNSSLEVKVSLPDLYYAQSHQLDPLGAAVANSVINVFEEEQVLQKSQKKIQGFNDFLKSLSYSFIKETRSYGMIFGIEIQSLKNLSSKELILKLKDKLLNEGILIGTNLGKNLLRFLPPLNIENEEIEFFKEKLTIVLNSL